MDVVIDTNVLFRTLISQGDILNLLFNPNLNIFAPEILRDEFLKNKAEISEKSCLSSEEFDKLFLILLNRITFISFEHYSRFIQQARLLLKDHEKDAEFIALGLLKNAKIWTYESRLFEAGIGISTKQISEQLKET